MPKSFFCKAAACSLAIKRCPSAGTRLSAISQLHAGLASVRMGLHSAALLTGHASAAICWAFRCYPCCVSASFHYINL